SVACGRALVALRRYRWGRHDPRVVSPVCSGSYPAKERGASPQGCTGERSGPIDGRRSLFARAVAAGGTSWRRCGRRGGGLRLVPGVGGGMAAGESLCDRDVRGGRRRLESRRCMALASPFKRTAICLAQRLLRGGDQPGAGERLAAACGAFARAFRAPSRVGGRRTHVRGDGLALER